MGTDHSVTRRDALKLGAATATAVSGLLSLGRDAGAAERPQSSAIGDSFRAEIDGCAETSKNIREIVIDELTIDARELTTGQDLYRVFVPGQSHMGQVTLVSGFTPAGSKEIQAWFDAWASGKNDFRNIVVTLLDRQRQPARGYSLYDCSPTKWHSVDLSPTSTVQTETLTVKVGRIEFKT